VLQQQARFNAFVARYNGERPHQALGLKVPADLYARSSRVYGTPQAMAMVSELRGRRNWWNRRPPTFFGEFELVK
jgi:hypothetical protein